MVAFLPADAPTRLHLGKDDPNQLLSYSYLVFEADYLAETDSAPYRPWRISVTLRSLIYQEKTLEAKNAQRSKPVSFFVLPFAAHCSSCRHLIRPTSSSDAGRVSKLGLSVRGLARFRSLAPACAF
jgi:hypothetical protein